MGYKRERKTYKLIFTDEYDGLEVIAKSTNVDSYLRISEFADIDRTRPLDSEDLKKVHALYESFSDVLVSWNLEDEDGNPIPANFEGLMSQDMEFTLDLILAWMNTIAGVGRPLEKPTTDLDLELESSMRMLTSEPQN